MFCDDTGLWPIHKSVRTEPMASNFWHVAPSCLCPRRWLLTSRLWNAAGHSAPATWATLPNTAKGNGTRRSFHRRRGPETRVIGVCGLSSCRPASLPDPIQPTGPRPPLAAPPRSRPSPPGLAVSRAGQPAGSFLRPSSLRDVPRPTSPPASYFILPEAALHNALRPRRRPWPQSSHSSAPISDPAARPRASSHARRPARAPRSARQRWPGCRPDIRELQPGSADCDLARRPDPAAGPPAAGSAGASDGCTAGRSG